MFIRATSVLLPLCLAGFAAAQTTQPTSKPTPVDLAKEVTGVAETAADRVAKLEAELAKLKNEMDAIKKIEERGGMVARIKRLISTRTTNVKSYAPPLPQAPEGGSLRLMSDDEASKFPPTTMMTVNGQAITESEVNGVASFISQWVTDEEEAKRQAVATLVQQRAAYAADPKVADANRERLRLASSRVIESAPFEEECKAISECPSAAKGGDLGELGVKDRDPMFMSTIMSLEPGDRSGIVTSLDGYHYVECLGRTGVGDDTKTQIRHIMVKYSPNAEAARAKAKKGLADIAFRRAEDMRLAPTTSGN